MNGKNENRTSAAFLGVEQFAYKCPGFPYDIRAVFNYEKETGKKMETMTEDELKPFLNKHMSDEELSQFGLNR